MPRSQQTGRGVRSAISAALWGGLVSSSSLPLSSLCTKKEALADSLSIFASLLFLDIALLFSNQHLFPPFLKMNIRNLIHHDSALASTSSLFFSSYTSPSLPPSFPSPPNRLRFNDEPFQQTFHPTSFPSSSRREDRRAGNSNPGSLSPDPLPPSPPPSRHSLASILDSVPSRYPLSSTHRDIAAELMQREKVRLPHLSPSRFSWTPRPCRESSTLTSFALSVSCWEAGDLSSTGWSPGFSNSLPSAVLLLLVGFVVVLASTSNPEQLPWLPWEATHPPSKPFSSLSTTPSQKLVHLGSGSSRRRRRYLVGILFSSIGERVFTRFFFLVWVEEEDEDGYEGDQRCIVAESDEKEEGTRPRSSEDAFVPVSLDLPTS